MLHEKNLNTVNIDKILDEARNRKPRMELEEIENLLQNKTRIKGTSGKWKNLSLIILSLIIAVIITLYFITDNSEKLTNKSSNKNSDKVASQKVIEGNQEEISGLKNTNPETLHENKKAGNVLVKNRKKHQNPDQKNIKIKEEKNTPFTSNPEVSNYRQELIYSEPITEQKELKNLSFKGWELVSKVPSQFNYGLDKEVVFKGNASAYINSEKSNFNSAWLTQEISAAPYAGKRLKMSAMVKSANAGKKAWAGIFMNIKGKDFKKAGYDNLYDKNINGQSDWVKCEIIMDIPEESKSITFGLYKVYGGNAWIDNIHLEVVNSDVPIHFMTQTEAQDTSLIQPDISSQLANVIVEKPSNLDFEKYRINDLPEGWHIGEEKQHFRAVADEKMFRSGKASACLQSNGYLEKDWNTLMQYCKAEKYSGKRLKITAYVRTENLKEHASFVFRVDGIDRIQNQENIKEITFTGDNNWRKTELILEIPETATNISYGLFLSGKGKIWMDDITIDEIPVKNGINNKISYKPPVNLNFEE